MMRSNGLWTKLFVISLLGLTVACANDPSITDQNFVRPIPIGYQAVSVCHSGEISEKNDVERLALSQCPVSASGLYHWQHDHLVNECPITKRNRDTFLCIK